MSIGNRSNLFFCVLVLLALSNHRALAEPGDYGYLKTLENLISPPLPNNPVTPEQSSGDYPLTANPPGFDDGFVPGAYYQWQTIHLHPSTGAVCGNGTPYKFFVNRVPGTRNMVVYMEGGGACWDFFSCSGRAGIRGARNPDGIPDNYLDLLNPLTSLVSPFVFRSHPWSQVKTQDWNLVYVPYCTGDVYAGDSVAVYPDPDNSETPLVWHHNGLRNVRAMLAWLKNNLQRPTQMLSTGCSAGGIGSLANYAHLRRDLAPRFGFILDDSGPLFPVTSTDSPSYPLTVRTTEAWGLQGDGVRPLDFLSAILPAFDTDNLGTLYQALNQRYPKDRMGHTHFWEDLNYSSYSYERFYDDIANEPDPAERERLIHELWYADTESLIDALEQTSNWGYYFPRYRAVNESHCTTIIEFANADIQELGLELDDFITDLLDGGGRPPLRAAELDTQADFDKPFNLFYYLLDLWF